MATKRLENKAIFIFGAGKVGKGLARALAAAGARVTLRPARKGLPSRRIDARFVIVAVRDREVSEVARALAEEKLIGHAPVTVVHCAGSLGPEAPAAAKVNARVSIAQMHPMISFASLAFTPSLARGQTHVDGDARAMKDARAIAKALGMSPRTFVDLDRVAYHAAAGLVANGAAALAAAGVALLERAGIDRTTGAAMLGPLLRSVAENVEQLGLPDALTGPVRRGDAAGVDKHLATLARLAPDLVPLYVAASRVQVPLARQIGDAPKESFDAIDVVLTRG